MAYRCNSNCEKCGHKCHCDSECQECVNDVCTQCECECTKDSIPGTGFNVRGNSG